MTTCKFERTITFSCSRGKRMANGAAFREIPDWALFTATVGGEPCAFDSFGDCVQKFEYRRRKGML